MMFRFGVGMMKTRGGKEEEEANDNNNNVGYNIVNLNSLEKYKKKNKKSNNNNTKEKEKEKKGKNQNGNVIEKEKAEIPEKEEIKEKNSPFERIKEKMKEYQNNQVKRKVIIEEEVVVKEENNEEEDEENEEEEKNRKEIEKEIKKQLHKKSKKKKKKKNQGKKEKLERYDQENQEDNQVEEEEQEEENQSNQSDETIEYLQEIRRKQKYQLQQMKKKGSKGGGERGETKENNNNNNNNNNRKEKEQVDKENSNNHNNRNHSNNKNNKNYKNPYEQYRFPAHLPYTTLVEMKNTIPCSIIQITGNYQVIPSILKIQLPMLIEWEISEELKKCEEYCFLLEYRSNENNNLLYMESPVVMAGEKFAFYFGKLDDGKIVYKNTVDQEIQGKIIITTQEYEKKKKTNFKEILEGKQQSNQVQQIGKMEEMKGSNMMLQERKIDDNQLEEHDHQNNGIRKLENSVISDNMKNNCITNEISNCIRRSRSDNVHRRMKECDMPKANERKGDKWGSSKKKKKDQRYRHAKRNEKYTPKQPQEMKINEKKSEINDDSTSTSLLSNGINNQESPINATYNNEYMFVQIGDIQVPLSETHGRLEEESSGSPFDKNSSVSEPMLEHGDVLNELTIENTTISNEHEVETTSIYIQDFNPHETEQYLVQRFNRIKETENIPTGDCGRSISRNSNDENFWEMLEQAFQKFHQSNHSASNGK